MPRKKTKKIVRAKAKKTVKKTKNSGLALVAAIQKEFKSAPAKIAALYRKESAVLKGKEKKMQAELKKVQAKAKKIQVKQAKVAKKSTSAAKKQLAKLHKNHSKISKVVSELTLKLDQVKNLVSTMGDKQAAYTALGKELATIEKQIDAKKPAKPTSNKTAKKAKAAKTPKSHAMNESAHKDIDKSESYNDIDESVAVSTNN